MNKKIYKYKILILLILSASLLLSCNHSDADKIKITDGTVYIHSNSKGLIPTTELNGKWDFYWNELLYPQDFYKDKKHPSKFQLAVPGNWTNRSITNRFISSQGYGTYRLKVKIDDITNLLSIKINEIGTAYKIFINGKDCGGQGIVSKNRNTGKPGTIPQNFTFKPLNNTIDIVIQVSNYHYRKGGIWHPIIIGDSEVIKDSYNVRIIIEVFLIGALLIMGLYHIIISLFNNRYFAPMFFGISIMFVSLRQLVISNKLLLVLFPSIPWSVYLRIEYLTLAAIIPTFALYLYHFLHKISKYYLYIIYLISIIFTIIVLATQSIFFTRIIIFYQIHLIIFTTYAVFHIIILSIKDNIEARHIFISGIFLLLFVLNDILYINKIIQTTYLSYTGIFIFVFYQIILFAKKFSLAFAEVENLSEKLLNKNRSLNTINSQLTQLKDTLEIKVKARTKDLKKAKEDAENANRAKSTFLANVSHELRTPLSAIIGFSQMLEQSNINCSDEQINSVKYIYESGENLLGVVNDILDISKIESEKIVLNRKNIILNDLILNTISTLKPLSDKKEIEIILNITDEKCLIYGDELKLIQVINNLISNAIKFTDNGKEIGIDLKKEEELIIISIWDQGIGIAEDDLEKVFKPFEQIYTEKRGKPVGTGLGLTIAEKFISLHEGTISLNSTQGTGSSFTITLPSVKNEPYEITEETININSIRKSSVELNGNLLIVEDNNLIIKLIKSILNNTDIKTTFEENGKDAIDTAIKNKFDLILMDINLPWINGIDAMKKINAHYKNEAPPIIALTAHAMSGDEQKYIELGFSDYISKPFTPEFLIQKISIFLK